MHHSYAKVRGRVKIRADHKLPFPNPSLVIRSCALTLLNQIPYPFLLISADERKLKLHLNDCDNVRDDVSPRMWDMQVLHRLL